MRVGRTRCAGIARGVASRPSNAAVLPDFISSFQLTGFYSPPATELETVTGRISSHRRLDESRRLRGAMSAVHGVNQSLVMSAVHGVNCLLYTSDAADE